jgi:hypothetical protein
MVNRRQFIKYGTGLTGLLALDACMPPHIAKVYEMFQKKPYPIEKELRDGRLAVNRSHNLRRYKALPGDPSTRELELITLARKEMTEESYVFAEPERVWYEIGIQFANDNNIPDDSHKGHTHKPSKEEQFSSRFLDSVHHMFSGKTKGIPKADNLFVYHFHPVFLRALNVYELGDERRKKENSYKSLEEWAYSVCRKPSPSSLGDYISDLIIKKRAKQEGINLVSRVADNSRIWEFGIKQSFDNWLITSTKNGKDYMTLRNNLTKTINSVDREMFLQKDINTAEDYVKELKVRVKKLNFPLPVLDVKFWSQVKQFNPSEQEFLNMLKKWKLVK